jgi:hypothetical protein
MGLCGSVTDPPMTYTQICVDVIIAVMAVAKLAPILLIGLQFLGRHLLDTQRINAWNAEWARSARSGADARYNKLC